MRRIHVAFRVLPLAVAGLLLAGSASGQTLPWEVTVAEIEAGRLRNLAERLSRQNLLYQLHLGEVQKTDLVETAGRIDRVIQSLERGSPSYSIPAPWTPALRAQIEKVDTAWGPVRAIAMASPYDSFRVTRQFMPAASRRGDPLLVRSFDLMSRDLIAASEKLLALYHEECVKTQLEVCATAQTSGYGAMLIERATKQAVFVVAGIDAKRHRKGLAETILAYQRLRSANNENPFFAAALDPERGVSAKAARDLFTSLRSDWDTMERQLEMLTAGDEKNYELRPLLEVQSRLVDKVERFTAAMIRYANRTYGS